MSSDGQLLLGDRTNVRRKKGLMGKAVDWRDIVAVRMAVGHSLNQVPSGVGMCVIVGLQASLTLLD